MLCGACYVYTKQSYMVNVGILMQPEAVRSKQNNPKGLPAD